MIKIGTLIDVERPVADAIEQTKRIKDAGFDSAWANQIFGADALTLLAVVGSHVADIELGTAVIPVYPRHPQMLAQQALMGHMPAARAAMTAVMRRLLEAQGTFDANGWLTVGFCGHQPHLGESYISTGSLYLCAAVFLPLGLPPADPFWAQPAQAWTAQKIWRGEDAAADHAI